MRLAPLLARTTSCALSALIALGSTGCASVAKTAELVAEGQSKMLRDRPEGAPKSSPGKPPILLLNLDGVGRDSLYHELAQGSLPGLTGLLGGGDGKGGLAHGYLERSLLATMPSITIAGWVTALTGATPSVHGITGNEFFARETRSFEAPVPATFEDAAPTLACYTDGYLNDLVKAPSVFEQMRAQDPDVLVWVAMQHFYRGADRLLLARRTALANALEGYIEAHVAKHGKPEHKRKLFASLDEQVFDSVISALDDEVLPDVLTVYLSGTDLYAHVAEEGPDQARSSYLREVLDPKLGKLADKLRERGALENRFVVVTADHGHTEVVHDDEHALSMGDQDDPPALVRKAGFRLRPFKRKVDEKDDFQAVLAYGGAVAYVYAADRSSCEAEGQPCDWSRPPRFREDVLPLAEAFYRNNLDGSLVPAMKGTLDMVLTREPRPQHEVDRPFEVYVGNGQLVPIGVYLGQHPHPTYVDLEARLRDLAVGPYGERAGDVMLVAHNGDREKLEDRYYFASLYHSWHGSPSRQDSEIPLVVAHPGKSPDELSRLTREAIGDHPRQQQVTDLLLALRGLEKKPR